MSSKNKINKRADIQAVRDRDPAAPKSGLVIKMFYPGVRAIRRHRRAQWFYLRGMKFIALWIAAGTRRKTGVDIHPAAKVGTGVFIDHASGVVIGETAEIGDNVTIYQGVTLGGTGKDKGKRHPTIGNNVMISAGAKVLGPINIGCNSKIGAGAVVLKDVPPNSTVVGVPGRVVRLAGVKPNDLNQFKDDPLLEELAELHNGLEALMKKFEQ